MVISLHFKVNAMYSLVQFSSINVGLYIPLFNLCHKTQNMQRWQSKHDAVKTLISEFPDLSASLNFTNPLLPVYCICHTVYSSL